MLQAPFGTVLFVISSIFSFAASAEDKARIAIIDTSIDTRPFLNQLATAGVKVIGRYYSRCRQGGGLGEKRLIDNRGDSPGDGKSESERILSHEAKYGVLSVYQFYSNSPNKYVGRDSRGNLLPDENCERPDHQQPNDVTKEAQLDANAAVNQARVVRQPPRTPIFFGVDFDYAASHETLMLQYFETVAAIARTAGYEMGAYGNGAALQKLKQTGRINYAWLNPSRGHNGSVGFFTGKSWDLFQTRIAVRFVRAGGAWLEADIDVQNAERPNAYVGFWNKMGRYFIAADRTKEIFQKRRMACDGLALILSGADGALKPNIFCGRYTDGGHKIQDCDEKLGDNGQPIFDPSYPRADDRSRVCYGDVVRILGSQGNSTAIDCDEDGLVDGWVKTDNLSANFQQRPTWENDRIRRRGLRRSESRCLP